MQDELLKAARDAVAMALELGADAAIAHAGRSRNVSFQWRDGALEQVKDATSSSVSIDLYANQRFSSHSTTDLHPDRLRSFLVDAVALTGALQADPDRSLADPSRYANRPTVDLALADERVRALDRDQRIAWCRAMDEAAHGHDAVVSATSGVEDGTHASAMVASNGFEGTRSTTSLSYGAEVTLEDAGKRPQDWHWVGGVGPDGLPSPEEVGREALARCMGQLGQRPGPTVRATMIVEPRAAGSLIGRLLGPANAQSIHKGRSFWAGKLGEKRLSEVLTLIDDPLRVGGLGSRLYDGEGVSAAPLTLIEGGVLRDVYADTYYARKAGLKPTTSSGSNRVVRPGDQDLAALSAAAGDGILVRSWLGGNADPTTGDFSFGIRGNRIVGGRVAEPINEMNVTGNLEDLFRTLVAVGNDPWPYSATLCPTLVFEGVQFSGVG